MTDDTERLLLMQQLQERGLSEWSAQEVDGFIVDAYLSLEASRNGQLRTANGLLVEPDMGEWGDICEDDEEERTYCVACLAGGFFVSKTGTLIPEDEQPAPYDYGVTSMNVLRFMDGLRYLEEDSECGESIANVLNTMGYAVYPTKGEYWTNMYGEKVAPTLKRLIDLNPRLADRLRVTTTKGEGV